VQRPRCDLASIGRVNVVWVGGVACSRFGVGAFYPTVETPLVTPTNSGSLVPRYHRCLSVCLRSKASFCSTAATRPARFTPSYAPFVPHDCSVVRSANTARHATAPHSRAAQANFKRLSLRSDGDVAQRAPHFQSGAVPSMASPISYGHPCPGGPFHGDHPCSPCLRRIPHGFASHGRCRSPARLKRSLRSRRSWFVRWQFKRRSLRSSVSPLPVGTSTQVPTAWLHLSLRSR